MSCTACLRETKYMCLLCSESICTVCADPCEEDENGYDEESYRVGKCPNEQCVTKKSPAVSGKAMISDYFKGSAKSTSVAVSVSPSPDTENSFPNTRKSDELSSKSVTVKKTTKSSFFAKRTKKSACSSSPNTSTKRCVPSSNPVVTENLLKRNNEAENIKIDAKKLKIDPLKKNLDTSGAVLKSFQKIFPELQSHEIHTHDLCQKNNCKSISSTDLNKMSKENKFQHKWLFDDSLAYCEELEKWCLVYIDGKGMFCTVCRDYDVKSSVNGSKQWNSIGNVRCRTTTIRNHLSSSMHKEALAADSRRSSSYFDSKEEKKVQHLKNVVYYKVFQSLYWLAKEEIATRKISSLLDLLEKQGVAELKYFETRSEKVIRKMLILIAQTIIEDVTEKIRESEFYGLLTDEVTDISNLCQLVSFIKLYDFDKGQTNTIFLDCSDLLSYSPTASPDAEAIVDCITQKFDELKIEIRNLRAFVSDGASVMVGEKGGAAQKIRKFSKTMINIHCICHRLALACSDTGDEYKFIQNVETYLIEIWKFFKNSSKRLRLYINVALKSRNFSGLSSKEQKKQIKRMKKACRTRWLSLHAGVDAAWDEFGGLIDALKELEKDRNCGPPATGLLRKINNYEFLGTLCLLKHVLPNLSALSKTFQTGSLNFSRITPSIEKCKDKLDKVVRDAKVLPSVKEALSNRLKNTGISLNDYKEQRITAMVQKYVDSMKKNISCRFPKESCEVLEAFSIFDAELIPSSTTSPLFNIYGDTEIKLLGKQFFPDEDIETVVSQWEDFKYELIQMQKKLSGLKKQFVANKLKFVSTSIEWSLNHIVKSYSGAQEFKRITDLAKIAAIVPVTNAWPERGASAVKRIKTRNRSQMKNDLLNSLLHVSINGPPVNSKEADNLISRVVEKYINQVHYKVPSKFTYGSINTATTSSTQTLSEVVVESEEGAENDEVFDIDIDDEEKEYLTTNMEVSDEEEDELDDEYENEDE